mmetsp:Transcript_12451/g.23636  ORF Transcript_12451/g.23636 Transcript_12451/m.23636 type:complete len:202 (-) Transcript_12451:100-705(-)|eukprot:CAMPEP_0114228688 /NCGR_PEP_ID=MMETSP0058-20121206/2486_1 /TAXON_ID=36894 /ORGANISM="Pyramimonas parkeae, CCMP726" /LENGTH=201 /DNA_ID=CAMNT_0001339671 /DNA_START=365 /DNA_END=970 /DNA_ORIENTATION=+
MGDYYTVLGVSQSANDKQLKDAYRKAAFACHPDRNHTAGASDEFKLVNQAYDVLKDQRSRSMYDLSIKKYAENPNPSPSSPQDLWEKYGQAWGAETAQAKEQRWRDRAREAEEEANFFRRQKAHAAGDKLRYREQQASIEHASALRRAHILQRFWQTRRGPQWQDFLVLGVLGSATIGAVLLPFPSRRAADTKLEVHGTTS